MSQAKVDKYKQQKQNRKNPKKKNKVLSIIKKVLPYAITAIVAIGIIGYLGISVAKQSGCYTPPTEPRSYSSQEIQSIRQVLIQATDPNVQYTTAKPETQPATQKAKASKKAVKTTKKVAETTKKKSYLKGFELTESLFYCHQKMDPNSGSI